MSRLKKDEHADVRRALVRVKDYYDVADGAFVRGARPRELLETLAKDRDEEVRVAALERLGRMSELASSDQPVEARLAAVKWGISIALERQLATDPSAEVRFKLAHSRHPRRCGRAASIDGEALALLLEDKSAKVREAASHLTAYPKGTKTPPR